MLLMFHIFSAIISIPLTALAAVYPRFNTMLYMSIGSMLISGTALVVVTHAPLMSTCVSGLCYIAILIATHVAIKQLRQRSSNV